MADDPGLPTGMVQNLSCGPGRAPRSLMLPEIQATGLTLRNLHQNARP